MRKLLILLALVATMSVRAQDDKMCFNHLTIGASLGTTGLGLEIGTPVSSVIALRGGVDFLPLFTVNESVHCDRPAALDNAIALGYTYVDIPAKGADIDVKGQPHFTQGHLLCDIYAFRNCNFHFTVGAYIGGGTVATLKAEDKAIAAVEQYNNDLAAGKFPAELNYQDGIKVELEGYPLTLKDGKTELDLVVNKVRPYVGIGFGPAVPKHTIGCRFDLGVMFWGTPKVMDKYGDCEIKKDDHRITSDFSDVIKAINSIPVYPSLKFTICGKIL